MSKILESPNSLSLRILLVEDDVLIRKILQDMLGAMGHDVCATASTESDAVEAATVHEPDLMIADATLRLGTGVGAALSILQQRKIAFVFVTGDPARVRHAPEHAVVVQKPVDSRTLAEAVKEAWERSGLMVDAPGAPPSGQSTRLETRMSGTIVADDRSA